jgi:hypothetical protein
MQSKLMKKVRGLLGLACAAALAGGALFAPRASAAIIYGVDNLNNLFNFNSNTPGTIISGHTITGLQTPGEQIIGLDGRASNSGLYGLSNLNRVYLLNPLTGAAISSVNMTTGLNGTSFGFDFNPVNNNARVVSNARQNLVVDPTTGVTTAGTDVAYAVGDANAGVNPNIVGSAYNNNISGATQTTLFDIDSGIDRLVTQDIPTAGTLHTVGPLGFDVTALLGFDIGADGVAFADMQTTTDNRSSLYTVNLGTGAASLVGQIDGGVEVRDIAIEPTTGFISPEPGSILSLGAVALCMVIRRRNSA